MSVKKLLEGSVFDPDQVRDLTRVYREVTAALSLTTRAAKEDAAKAIIRIAREQTDFDAAKLRGQVMDELAREPWSQDKGRGMPLIVGGLIALAMTWAVAKNDQAHKEALQQAQQQIRQQHDQARPVRDLNAEQKIPGG
jgi:hypothetical protein